MMFLRSEIATLEHTRMTVAASPMLTAEMTLPVIARVGQVPRTRMRTGFSAIIPRRNIASLLI